VLERTVSDESAQNKLFELTAAGIIADYLFKVTLLSLKNWIRNTKFHPETGSLR
jgi:hypothetical protein